MGAFLLSIVSQAVLAVLVSGGFLVLAVLVVTTLHRSRTALAAFTVLLVGLRAPWVAQLGRDLAENPRFLAAFPNAIQSLAWAVSVIMASGLWSGRLRRGSRAVSSPERRLLWALVAGMVTEERSASNRRRSSTPQSHYRRRSFPCVSGSVHRDRLQSCIPARSDPVRPHWISAVWTLRLVREDGNTVFMSLLLT